MLTLNSEIQADILKTYLHFEEQERVPTVSEMAVFLQHSEREVEQALEGLKQAELIHAQGGFTEPGRRHALAQVRTHRLLEVYLRTQTGLPIERVHREADRMEHGLSPLEVEKIADALSHPRYDPHGDPIPTRGGLLPVMKRVALSKWPSQLEGRIAHIEDEPEEDCRKIVALGIARGARVRVEGESLIWHHGRTIAFPKHLWTMIGVEPLASDEKSYPESRPLADFSEGEIAEIIELDPLCIGAARNRLLDLGIVSGTRIIPDFAAPFGGPRTYRIRGTCIALRREQSMGILARPLLENANL